MYPEGTHPDSGDPNMANEECKTIGLTLAKLDNDQENDALRHLSSNNCQRSHGNLNVQILF